jgi:hypothetical protein
MENRTNIWGRSKVHHTWKKVRDCNLQDVNFWLEQFRRNDSEYSEFKSGKREPKDPSPFSR